MNYCRFHNTLADLKDCLEHFEDELSESERKDANKLVALCGRIHAEYSDQEAGDEND